MNFVLELFVVVIISICISSLFIYFHYTKHYNYWKKRKVPYIEPLFPFGSTIDLLLGRTYIGKGYDKMYNTFPNERFFGIIDVQNPVLVLRNPDLIKAVLVRDFHHFTVRTNLGANSKEYILKHVINMSGDEWKEMRELLTPAFTSSKIKSLFGLMEKCSENLLNHLFLVTNENLDIDVTNLFARYTMDIIATCAFGVQINSISNPNCVFFRTVGKMLKTTRARFFRRFLVNFFPSILRFLPVTLIPADVTDLLTTTVRQSVAFREETNLRRNDFLDSLIESRQTESKEECSSQNDNVESEKGKRKGNSSSTILIVVFILLFLLLIFYFS